MKIFATREIQKKAAFFYLLTTPWGLKIRHFSCTLNICKDFSFTLKYLSN